MKKVLALLILSFAFSATGAQPDEIYYRERDLEQKISQLAQVQFGSDEIIAVRVQAVIARKAVPAADKPSADVGYLPLPYNEGTTAQRKDEVEGYDVNLMASNRVNKAALQTFQMSVRRLVAPLKSKVNLQVVQYNEVNERKPASEPEKPEAGKEKEQLTPRDFLFGGVFFLSVLLGSIFILFGVRMLGRALRSMAEALDGTLKLKSDTKKSENDAEGAVKGDDSPVYRKNENISQALGLRQSVESLKRSCKNDPLKVVQSLGDGPEDILGLRWLLSQLNDQERQEMKAFLEESRIRSLSKNIETPVGFNVLNWAQMLIERIAVRKMENQSQLERALNNEEIAFLYKVPQAPLLSFAKKQRSQKVWKLVLEVVPGETLSRMDLTNEDWNLIIEGQALPAEAMKEACQVLKDSPELQNVDSSEKEENKIQLVIVPNIIASLKLMKIDNERAFLEDLKRTQEQLYSKIKERFWSYSELPLLNQDRLRIAVAGLSNEVLFSVLLVAPEQEREMLKEMIPPGMKRSVVLDLTEKALAKADDQEYKTALRISRDFFDDLLKVNQTSALYQPAERTA